MLCYQDYKYKYVISTGEKRNGEISSIRNLDRSGEVSVDKAKPINILRGNNGFTKKSI